MMRNQGTLFDSAAELASISPYYDSKDLSHNIKLLEAKYNVTDESDFFYNLVNFSRSTTQPYHKWVKYREGYSADLVKELIARSGVNPIKDFVIDPMSGSGTTLLAAAESGFDGLGLDVNPFCTLIAETKLWRPEASILQNLSIDAHAVCKAAKQADCNADRDISNRFRGYFEPTHLDALDRIKFALDNVKIKRKHTRKILYFSWLSIIEECSNRKKDGNGLATVQTRVGDVYSRFQQKVTELVYDYTRHPILTRSSTRALTASATRLGQHALEFMSHTNKEAGAVIFSPPYANSFDYFESYKLELLYGELVGEEEFLELRSNAVRNYRINDDLEVSHRDNVVELLCTAILKQIPIKEQKTGVRDGRTRLVPNLLRGYFSDMKDVMEQILLCLRPGGKCYIVVDQSSYVGVIIPTDLVLAKIADVVGFEVNGLIKCRRAITSGQQMREYPYLKTALRESIVELRKPG